MEKYTKKDENTGSSSQHGDSLDESASNKTRKSRRRLIQGLVAGGVVVTAKTIPSSWSSPVVKSVILPAHATTSGELITLGNNRLNVNNTQDMEKTESLLASGIEPGWGGILDTFVKEAGAQDDTPVCELTGCNYIEYRKGENSGKLFIGIYDFTSDAVGTTEVVLNFTDGQQGSFNDTCLTIFNGFLVELISDTLAKLTIIFAEKKIQEIDLVKNFFCEPVEDGAPG